jgi:hypothetical protein
MRAMRRAAALFAFLAGSMALAPRARAADADLPSGDEPPRFIPTAVVDSYFAYHFTEPNDAVQAASFTSAATRQREFAVNLAAFGARLEHAHLLGAIALQAGSSVDILYPATTPGSSNGIGSEVYKHVQVAYAGYRTGDFTFTMGLFPSLFGVEGFQTTSNWNYMKSFIGDLRPYYQEGAKVSWRVLPSLQVTGVVSNGWQTHGHVPNKSPSYSGRIDWSISDEIRLFDAVHVGKETRVGPWNDGVGNADTRIYDELTIQANFGKRVSAAVTLWGAKQGSSKAYGAVAWAKWSFMDRLYAAVRGEYFKDGDGFLFEGLSAPFLPDVTAETRHGATFEAGTLTLGWIPHESFIVKAEGVYRRADRNAFYGDTKPVSPATPFDANDTHSITASLSAAFVY